MGSSLLKASPTEMTPVLLCRLDPLVHLRPLLAENDRLISTCYSQKPGAYLMPLDKVLTYFNRGILLGHLDFIIYTV